MRAVRLYIARHGESRGNLAGVLQGSRVDEPLSPRGLRQAEALSARLAPEPIDAVHTSPMIRARETAEIVNAPHGLPIAFDEDLVEFDWGVWCGHPLDDAMERQVAEIRARWRAGDVDDAPAGGESPAAAGRRAARFLGRLAATGATHALVVAHGRFNRILMATLLSRPLSRMDEIRQRNGSLSSFEWNGSGAVTPILLDDVGHLPPDLRSVSGGSDSLR
jgi:broad specificity phosphatase PhoE